MEKENSYIKCDDRIINEKYIRWAKKINECIEICCKMDGCRTEIDTVIVSKQYSPTSYAKLNKQFE